MRTLLKEEFQKEFLIYKKLNASKPALTCIAMVESDNKIPFPVFLKETDAKRAEIYDKLTGLWNPYIADTYEVLKVTDSDKSDTPRYFAVTEYVTATGSPNNESISLAEYIKRNGAVSEKMALVLCIQLCTGLKEFHEKGFVHRDLKPDNLMISHYDFDNMQIKIVDFGGAKWNNPDKHADTTVVGTLGYQTPESLAVPATDQSDIYSIGCILNYLLTGQEPGLIRYKGNHYIENIIEIATNNDPCDRYTNVTEMQKALEHQSLVILGCSGSAFSSFVTLAAVIIFSATRSGCSVSVRPVCSDTSLGFLNSTLAIKNSNASTATVTTLENSRGLFPRRTIDSLIGSVISFRFTSIIFGSGTPLINAISTALFHSRRFWLSASISCAFGLFFPIFFVAR